MKKSLQHSLNALHMYCRLRDFGLPIRQAKKIATIYEFLTNRLLYSQLRS